MKNLNFKSLITDAVSELHGNISYSELLQILMDYGLCDEFGNITEDFSEILESNSLTKTKNDE
jgi:hypothetical protein